MTREHRRAVEMMQPKLPRKAGAAMHLDRDFGGGLRARSTVQPGGCDESGRVRRICQQRVGGGPNGAAAGLDTDMNVGGHMLDCLERSDRLAELATRARIIDAAAQAFGRESD